MHHAHGAGILEVEQVVAVGDGVERVGDRAREAQELRGALAVQRVGGAGERGSPERVGVRGVARGGEAREVAREHPEVREQVVGEQYRLRVLEVRIAGHHDVEVLVGGVEKDAAQLDVAGHELLAEVLGEQADVGCHLVVAGASGVQAPAGRADRASERTLHGHVDVLVVDVPGEGVGVDLRGDVGEARVDRGLVLGRDDALLGEHARMRAAAGDVVGRHVLVDLEARAELLRELVHALLEPAAPQRHRGSFLGLLGD